MHSKHILWSICAHFQKQSTRKNFQCFRQNCSRRLNIVAIELVFPADIYKDEWKDGQAYNDLLVLIVNVKNILTKYLGATYRK